VSFFDDAPEPDLPDNLAEDVRMPPWLGPPANEVGGPAWSVRAATSTIRWTG